MLHHCAVVLYQLKKVLFVFLREVGDVQHLRRWIEILPFWLRADVLFALLVLHHLPSQQSVVMREEDLNAVFDAVQKVLGLGCILDMLVFHQHRFLVFDADDFTDITEIQQDIVQAANSVVTGDRTYEQHLGRTVLH